MMRNSVEDLIREARGNAVEDFKLRFMQKWYDTTPCFHWRELNLSSELKELVLSENPSIWLFNYNENELDLDDKHWAKNELHKVLVFDWINDGIASLNENEQSSWLKNNIATAMQMFDIDQEDFILCYSEGKASFSKEWRIHFENRLKV
jgi:hypothetical protein